MTTTDPLARIGTQKTPQTQQVPGRTDQVKNNAGGFVFEIDDFARLRRFLTIGTSGGTYYVNERDLTLENATFLIDMISAGNVETHKKVVDEIVAVSVAGRAPKQNPTLFALAVACQMGETEGKQYARAQINQVVRTGTHLFIFVRYLKQFGGWSRGLRKAVGNWYAEKDSDKLALQLIKYRQREGFTHRDVLRLTHPKVEGPGKRAAIDWAVKGKAEDQESVPDFIKFFQMAQAPDADIPSLLERTYLPWEALPDSAMNDTKVWDKLLDNGMPINALVRQLPRLTRLGMLPPMGDGRTDDVIQTLLNPEAVSKSRIHPFQVLVALKTYQQGHGERGSSTWTPSRRVLEALDEMYYLSFGNVESTGKRWMNALDVSGSMGSRAGGLPLTCYEVVAAMAMVTVRTEPLHMTTAFTSNDDRGYARYGGYGIGSGRSRNAELIDFPINKRQSLSDVMSAVTGLPHRGTDCSLPMLHAMTHDLEVDTFVVYTDNETWSGQIHPYQAIKSYRKETGIDAKLVVVSITPTRFSIADPKDPGMLDVSGFDSATPQFISDFAMGRV